MVLVDSGLTSSVARNGETNEEPIGWGGGGGWMNFLDFRGSGAKSSQKKMVGESNPGGCCVLEKNQAVGPLLLGFS